MASPARYSRSAVSADRRCEWEPVETSFAAYSTRGSVMPHLLVLTLSICQTMDRCSASHKCACNSGRTSNSSRRMCLHSAPRIASAAAAN